MMFPLVLRLAPIGLLLAACVAAPVPTISPKPPATAAGPAANPAPPKPVLTERTPDSCRLASLQSLIGQPSGNLRTVRLAGASRIIPPGGIISQEDYQPQRINAHIDQRGVITRLECG
ncbi:hypothetical protein HOY34_04805 [Xinfangfangia sp. D13-10-4-6]|uniref:I78 family peptidase inhibitor n=1 Tax=Pseudogemmobacter hezensis TaxID=2737662 RepID=UPI001556EAC0|nr:I78 family peptidase inhibitor [Pseudogemmobacter hezensis]NPD14520.1 hypothetical protein [Pseudogemmobacter hezensis]